MTKRFTVTQVAKMVGLCKQRIQTKIMQGHYPNHGKCECGRSTMIPARDLELPINSKRKK